MDVTSVPRLLASTQSLPDGASLSFEFNRDGLRIAAFLVRVGDAFAAFDNVCRHIPIPLDYGDDEFFTTDRRHLVCQTHGALYEPLTGRCVQGPCAGASLKPVRIEVRDGAVWLVESEEGCES